MARATTIAATGSNDEVLMRVVIAMIALGMIVGAVLAG